MDKTWAIISVIVLAIVFYLGFTAVINIGWVIGFALITLVVFFVVFEILDNVFGLGTIGAIILALILFQLFAW
ncbi:hypothetical protein M3225_26865 [Priestia aryabhattai]|uniref:hypothetical protein n=1 Tax=Priestia aryabhattai TaxID=412384 RepID=UPI00203C8D87|nr:hypothetical protein [Priestia aryabhattai]MCM3774042.1 hypothetical protein [Priestia aryabhattai]